MSPEQSEPADRRGESGGSGDSRWRRAGGPTGDSQGRAAELGSEGGSDRAGQRGRSGPDKSRRTGASGRGRSDGPPRRSGPRDERGGTGSRNQGKAGGGRGRSDRVEPRRSDGGDRRGPRSWDRAAPADASGTRRDPEIAEGVTGRELDRSVWHELRTLTKENAEGVAQHLVMSALMLDVDTDLSLSHAQTAARRAGRVAAVREGLGLVHYRRGEFADALREFRTARRLSGSNHLLPYMVDCERGLGRPERALELAGSPEAKSLGEDDNIELAIVVSGVRRDMGQPDAARMVLRIPALERARKQSWAARLQYAYAEALLASGDEDGAGEWFSRAVTADQHQETDAAERLAELQGITLEDLGADLDDTEEENTADDGDREAEVADDRSNGPGEDSNMSRPDPR